MYEIEPSLPAATLACILSAGAVKRRIIWPLWQDVPGADTRLEAISAVTRLGRLSQRS